MNDPRLSNIINMLTSANEKIDVSIEKAKICRDETKKALSSFDKEEKAIDRMIESMRKLRSNV